MTTYLSVSNVQCARNGKLLFQPVDFTINSGEIIHLRGENGIGKTTLLRCLVGLSKPFIGEIQLREKRITASDVLKQKLHYLGHKQGLNESLTAFENLHYLATHLPASLRAKQVQNALDILGLTRKTNVLVGNLSAGQKQRLAWARITLASACLWVLDEPFSALDQQGFELAQTIIEKYSNEGGMVILTSHQALSKQFKCHKIIELTPCSETIEQEAF